MKKQKVRCVKGFGVIGSLHNFEVVKPISGFGYGKKMFGCAKCGELFVVDCEYCEDANFTSTIDATEFCPQCGSPLNSNLFSYPDHVFLSGQVVKLDQSTIIYDQDESIVRECWSIEVGD